MCIVFFSCFLLMLYRVCPGSDMVLNSHSSWVTIFFGISNLGWCLPHFLPSVLFREVCDLLLLPSGLHVCVPHWDRGFQRQGRGVPQSRLRGYRLLRRLSLQSLGMVRILADWKEINGSSFTVICKFTVKFMQQELDSLNGPKPTVSTQSLPVFQSLFCRWTELLFFKKENAFQLWYFIFVTTDQQQQQHGSLHKYHTEHWHYEKVIGHLKSHK